MITERVHLRIIICPECSNQRCHVNSRLPNFCCECSASLLGRAASAVIFSDNNATIRYNQDSET